MHKLLIVLSCVLLGNACVKKSIYRTEIANRQMSEAREKVLSSELADRKLEAEKMVSSIGELNRIVGKQEGDIAELRAKIVQLSTNANKTSSALLDEKSQLEKQLNEKNALLSKATSELERLKKIIGSREMALADLKKVLSDSFVNEVEIAIVTTYDAVIVGLPDKLLFEANGLNLTTNGRTMLNSIAAIIADRPTLNIDIIANTDNQLPKGNKTITDTWDWSLRRATTIARTLISDFSVNANQISPIGRGEFYPVASNETPEGRLQNRRTEIIFKPVLAPVR